MKNLKSLRTFFSLHFPFILKTKHLVCLFAGVFFQASALDSWLKEANLTWIPENFNTDKNSTREISNRFYYWSRPT